MLLSLGSILLVGTVCILGLRALKRPRLAKWAGVALLAVVVALIALVVLGMLFND